MKLKQLTALLLPQPLMAVPSTFDPTSFGAGSFEGVGDTRRFKLPPKEYSAFVVGPWGEDKKTRIRVEKGYVILDLVWQPADAEVAAEFKLDKLPTVRQSIFLDMTDSGGLDMGPFKNAELNKLREVFGLNAEGVKWSFQDFIGKPAKIVVEHRPNKDNPNDPFANVTAVKK